MKRKKKIKKKWKGGGSERIERRDRREMERIGRRERKM